MQRYLTIGWERLHLDARALATALMPRGPFKGIVAVSRGGLIPAAIVARELDIRLVESVCVVTYQEQAMGEPVVIKAPAVAGDGCATESADGLLQLSPKARAAQSGSPAAE